MFELMLNVLVLLMVAPIGKVLLETVSTGVALVPSCVTTITCDVKPVPETVTFAVRVDEVGFTVAVAVIVALFEPEVLLNVNQVWSLATDQLLPANAAIGKALVETLMVDAPAD
jgi:hypothetical protein